MRSEETNPLGDQSLPVAGVGAQSSVPPHSSLLTLHFRARGPLLGVDFGLKRIGLAVCDPDRLIASPLGTHDSGPANEIFFRNLFAQNKFVGIVIGLPLHANGDESDMSRQAREFAKWLADLSGLPFLMWDERCTSAAAESVLRDAKLNWRKRKGKVDRVAAQMILQSFIDAGCPVGTGDPNSG